MLGEIHHHSERTVIEIALDVLSVHFRSGCIERDLLQIFPKKTPHCNWTSYHILHLHNCYTVNSQQSDEVLQNSSGFCLLKWFPIGTILKFVALPIAHALLKKLFWRQLFEENHCFDPFRPNEHPQVIYGSISTIRWQKYKIFFKSKKSLEFL